VQATRAKKETVENVSDDDGVRTTITKLAARQRRKRRRDVDGANDENGVK
jgi:hypothetical protein